MHHRVRRRTGGGSSRPWGCESLEPRQLFTAFVINGTSAADTINVSWHLKIISLQSHAFVDWSINGGATQSQDLAAYTSVTIDTVANSSSSDADTVNLLTTPARPYTVVGHAGGGLFGPWDTLNVGSAGSLQGINGPVSLSTSGIWNVTLDNSADSAAARTATVNNSSVTGLFPGSLTWDSYLRVNNLTINTGTVGGDTITLIAPNTSGSTYLNSYSQGPDEALVIGANHLSNSAGPINLAAAPGAPRGLWNVSIDDSGENAFNYYPNVPSTNINAGILTGLTGTRSGLFGISGNTSLQWAAGSVRAMTVAPMTSQQVGIGSLDVPMTINLSGDFVSAGSNSGLQTLAAPLTLNGNGTVALVDSNDVASRSILMSRAGAAVTIDGLAPATISYNLTSGAVSPTVELDLWNTFNGGTLTALASGQPGVLVKVIAPQPIDVSVGNATTAPDIQGTFALYCTGSNLKNTLHVNDSIDPTSRTITVAATKDTSGTPMGVIRGLGGGGDVDYAVAQTAGPVTIDGGAGGNTFTVAAADPNSGAIAVGVPLTLNLGTGNDTATIQTNAVTVNGQAGNDTVTVDYTGITVSGSGTFTPGDVAFDGGANSDTLSVLGKLATQPFGVIATAVTQGAQTTSFSNVESMALASGAFALAGDLNGLNLSLSGSGSTAALSTSQHLGTLAVAGGAVATLNSSASALGKTVFATGLSLTTGGTLDLTNNALRVTYATDPAAAIRGYLATGYNNGAWTGTGLRSSTAASGPANVYSLGLGDSADNYVSGLPANTLLVRYTVMGDANLDGTNNYTDALRLQANYNHTNANWDQADFNFDGVVNSLDALLMSRNYNAVLPAAVEAASQPTTPPQTTTTPTPAAPSTNSDTDSVRDHGWKRHPKRHGK